MEQGSLLAEQIEFMGLSMPKEIQEKALSFLDLLQKWNRVYNLTAIKKIKDMVVYHLLDSLSVAKYLVGDTVLDVGTGAGFPGIPLALYYPQKKFTLIESNGKKTRFLFYAKTVLELNNVKIVHSRSENYQTSSCFDAIIFRAVKSIPEMIKRTQHLCCQRGIFLAMKASYPAAELLDLNIPFTVHRLTVPGLSLDRHLVILRGMTSG